MAVHDAVKRVLQQKVKVRGRFAIGGREEGGGGGHRGRPPCSMHPCGAVYAFLRVGVGAMRAIFWGWSGSQGGGRRFRWGNRSVVGLGEAGSGLYELRPRCLCRRRLPGPCRVRTGSCWCAPSPLSAGGASVAASARVRTCLSRCHVGWLVTVRRRVGCRGGCSSQRAQGWGRGLTSVSVSLVCVCVVATGFVAPPWSRVWGGRVWCWSAVACALWCAPPPPACTLRPITATLPLLQQACYRTEGVNYRKKCAAVVAQYEAVHRAPGAPPAAAATAEE